MSTTQQLLLLRDIAAKPAPNAGDINAVAAAVARPLYARFFYSRANGAPWAEIAAQEILYGALDDEGAWLRLRFILRIYDQSPPDLLRVLDQLRPKIDRWMSREVVITALRQSPENAWALRSFVMDSVLATDAEIAPDVGAYLAHVSTVIGDDLQELLILIGSIVSFVEDPKQTVEAKKMYGPNPVPRVEPYSYQQILEKGVRPLARLYPLGIAKTLTDALADLMQFKVQSAGQETESYDTSRGWCSDVAEPTSSHVDADESLVHALTFACNLVFSQSDAPTNQVRALDAMLRAQRWLIFNRIRLHLYANNPKVAREWCTLFARQYEDYGQGTYPSDVMALLRNASEQLGEEFLTKADREKIFAVILNSTAAEEYLKRTERPLDPDSVHKARLSQLQRDLFPFEPVLFGEARETYYSVIAETRAPPSRASYELLGGSGIHEIETRSPIPTTELAAMKDADLVKYLNTWSGPKRDQKEWWVETNADGLAGAFKQCLTENPVRFAKWGVRWRRVKRPRYIRTAIDFASEQVRAKKFDYLPKWLGLVEWVTEASRKQCDEPPADMKKKGVPEWVQLRRNAVDFIGTCLDAKVPYDPPLRRRFGKLVTRLCIEPDPWLEQYNGRSEDPLTDAINTTRGRAFEILVQLAFWVRDDGKKPNHRKELREVLARRFAEKPVLETAEHAQLGRLYPFLVNLDRGHALSNRAGIFPSAPTLVWKAAFSSLVLYAEANKSLFEFLAHEFDFALRWLPKLQESEKKGRWEFIPRLGQHIFLYYVWGCFPLNQDDDLLSRFYAATKPEDWRSLMQFTGRILSNSTKLSPEIQQRCEAFLAFRLEKANATELEAFSFWLFASAFPVRWRLENFIRTLEIAPGRKQLSSFELKKVTPFLSSEPALTVEAFGRLTSSGGTRQDFYFDAGDVWPILEAGFSSPDIATREWAEIAQNNLLDAGLFEYLEKTTAS